MPDLEKQKQEFLTLCRKTSNAMDLRICWAGFRNQISLRLPPATRYHGAYEGGLCEHSGCYHMAKKAIAGYELEAD